MIDYAKIFKEYIEKHFEEEAERCRTKHPRECTKQGVSTFGLAITQENKDNLSWVEGNAFAYTCKLADLLQNYKIKSIDITIDYNPDIADKNIYALLNGKLEIELR